MNESFSPTVINLEGKVIAFGAERFLSDVLGGGCCCICGEKRDDKPFNDEHVIPDWLQRAAKLHAQKITLPNGTPFPYGQYKVPCCVDCNSLYGKELEERVAVQHPTIMRNSVPPSPIDTSVTDRRCRPQGCPHVPRLPLPPAG